MKVQVYWNLHQKCWSVVSLEGHRKGRVVAHTDKVFIRDASFVVQPAGRQRVRSEKRKNVHAFVRGTWMTSLTENTEWKKIIYNPYKYDTFVFSENEEPVFSAKSVAMFGPRNVRVTI